MKQQRTPQEIYASVCYDIKDMYLAKGELISGQEAKGAADNLIRFCTKAIEIKSKVSDDTNPKQ